LTKAPKAYDGGKTAPSPNVAGKTGYLLVENGNQIQVFTLCEYQLKVNEGP
jgi:hypothetical protein